MSDFFEHLAFVSIAITLYLPAHKAKFLYSGRNFTRKKMYIATIYNIAMMAIYLDFSQTGQIPFYGQVNTSILGWFAIVMLVMHATAPPMEWKRRRWSLRKPFDPKIRKHLPTIDLYRMQHGKKPKFKFWRRNA